MVPYDHKEYNSKEINQLDYEEAIIYDKRNYCQIFWCTLKEKQTLINTFFVKDPLKPFSIKLLVIIFSFSSIKSTLSSNPNQFNSKYM